MDRLNILNKVGMLSDEDKKEPLVHGCSYFTFRTCLDLSKPIEVIPYGTSDMYSVNDYSNDVASFISWWTYFVRRDLNGFGGFSHVKFILKGFKLV